MKHIAFITSIADTWGGSEELWSRTVPLLLRQGYKLSLLRVDPDPQHPRIAALRAMGVEIIAIRSDWSLFRKFSRTSTLHRTCNDYQRHLEVLLHELSPDLVVVSQGVNFDGMVYAYVAMQLGIPYITLANKAVEIAWPLSGELDYLRATTARARKNIFVSRHALEITEMQLCRKLDNALVVHPPVSLRPAPLPWPDAGTGLRLACVGRFYFLDKGQDRLLRVLAQDKWRSRPLSVDFIGKGEDQRALKDLITYFGLSSASVEDHVPDGAAIWNDYHALVLSSHFEGLPIVLLEAMAAGRTAIVTDAGGCKEMLEDQRLGFVGAPTVAGLDEALERAWQQQSRWQEMGLECFQAVHAAFSRPSEQILFEIIDNEAL